MKFFKDQFGSLVNAEKIRVIRREGRYIRAYFDTDKEGYLAEYLTPEEATAALEKLEKELNEDS